MFHRAFDFGGCLTLWRRPISIETIGKSLKVVSSILALPEVI